MADLRQPATGGSAGESAKKASNESVSSSKPRILVVDDTPTNRKLIQAMLRHENFELHEADNGLQALELASQIDPDLILLDIMMPGKDGYAVCKELKADPKTAGIPVIFLSAHVQTADRVKGIELGAADYITKPFKKDEILARIQTHLEIRMLSRSLTNINGELARKQHELDESMKAAASVQDGFIPADDVRTRFEELAAAWRFVSSGSLGGDAFNVFRLDQDHLGFYVLDVSGRGVPAAMMTVSVSQCLTVQLGSALKKRIDEPPHYRLAPPHEVLEELDKTFPIERFERFCSINYVLLNAATGELRFCGAGQPRPLLYRRKGELETLESSGTIVGLGDVVPFRDGTTKLEPGDRLFLYTIGAPGRVNRWAERFGNERLMQRVRAVAEQDLQSVCDEIIGTLEQFAGGVPPADDVTFVALEYRGRG